MKPNPQPLSVWCNIVMALFFLNIAFWTTLQAQGTIFIQGSIGKSNVSADSNKVIVYGISSNLLDQVIFESINFCISLPDQGDQNPNVNISQNFIPAVDWTYAGSDYPDIVNGRAYYTFIGNDNETGNRVSWLMNEETPVVELNFTGGEGKLKIQLNDLTEAEGIGSGGGPGLQSFWYVQLNGFGDVTNYQEKYFKSSGSQVPENGGLAAPSFVETEEEIALPVFDLSASAWLLFPNPTAGRIHIIPGYTGMAHFRFFDISGKVLVQEKRDIRQGNAITFDCGYFPPGVQVLEVRTNEGHLLYTEQIIMNESRN